jgi:hypothetical protein
MRSLVDSSEEEDDGCSILLLLHLLFPSLHLSYLCTYINTAQKLTQLAKSRTLGVMAL